MIIDANKINALLLLAPKKDSRDYLNSIYIDKAGRMVATDGHRMGIVPIDKGDESFIIPRSLLDTLKPKGTVTIETIPVKGGMLTLQSDGKTVQGQAVDAKYPDYLRVIPQEVSGEIGQFDPNLLGDFGKVAKMLGVPSNAVDIIHNGENNSAIVKMAGFFGVVMPCRRKDGVDMSVPGWVTDA